MRAALSHNDALQYSAATRTGLTVAAKHLHIILIPPTVSGNTIEIGLAPPQRSAPRSHPAFQHFANSRIKHMSLLHRNGTATGAGM